MMCAYIGIEDLAANALIEVLRKATNDFLLIKRLRVMVQRLYSF